MSYLSSWCVLQYDPESSEYVLVETFRQYEDAARYRIILAYDAARYRTVGGFLTNFWEEYERITIMRGDATESTTGEIPGGDMQRILKAALRELDDLDSPTIHNFSKLLNEIRKYHRVEKEYLEAVLEKISGIDDMDEDIRDALRELLKLIFRIHPSLNKKAFLSILI